MNKKVKLKGQINAYLQWPMKLTVIPAVFTVVMFIMEMSAAPLMLACTLIYFAASVGIYYYLQPAISDQLVGYGVEFAQVQRRLMGDLDVPYGLLDNTGKLLWSNKGMKHVLGEYIDMKNISALIPEIKQELLSGKENKIQYLHVRHKDQYYKAELREIDTQNLNENNTILVPDSEDSRLFALYLFEETEVINTRKDIQNQKLACGIIFIDNYEEALSSTEEVRRSLLSALVDRKINKYLQNFDAIVNKMEKDRYIFVMRQQYLPLIQSSKFSLLDEVREINLGNEMSVTLCIGMGVNAESYGQALDWAKYALDLALGRGGDQAVVKDRKKVSYYGGKTKQVEKSTRVRARVKAHALKQVIDGRDQVVIMGHKIGDVDCIGAAIGVYRAARILNKKAFIVLNDVTTSVKPIIEPFRDNPDYDSDMFITSEQARGIVDSNTALVVVDVNISNRTEAPELLKLTKTIVVIDHHRSSGAAIENPVLSYVEPYASSACEMVAEILQYIADSVKLRTEEADALYAGMLIDTNNFISKTGVRTFEAAAFLRRAGADITRVHLMLRDDMTSYKAKAEVVKSAVVEGNCAYGFLPPEGLESPTIVGAQAANDLLNIVGIEASFVFTKIRNTVYISARSYETMNVQLVMERMGGGGHSTIAGAQLPDVTEQEAYEKVKAVVKQMKAEGEI